MITVRKSKDRGVADHGWLNSKHSFSFADYHDPKHMGLGPLRVINEDKVGPGSGFDTHGHRDMEIISYVLDGELRHKDSMGMKTTIKPGDVQRMSAGTGVRHSEYNNSNTDQVHFLQIWIIPERKNLPPSYAQDNFDLGDGDGGLVLVGSRDGRGGSLVINQSVDLYAAKMAKSTSVTHAVAAGRSLWLQVVRGAVTLNAHALAQGDGAAVQKEKGLEITATENSEFLLFDMT